MNKYIIYCTEEQTRKALKLGAPIEIKYGSDRYNPSSDELRYLVNYGHMWYKKPTAEQMIGWLEDAGIIIIYMPTNKHDGSSCRWVAHIWRFQDEHLQDEIVWIDSENLSNLSRKKVTLAAIDAALEYLEKANEE